MTKRLTYLLSDGKERHPVSIGMVASDGAFLLLLDEQAPHSFYHFSGEADALQTAREQVDYMEKRIELLEASRKMHIYPGELPVVIAAELLDTSTSNVAFLARRGKLEYTGRKDGNRKYLTLQSVAEYARMQAEERAKDEQDVYADAPADSER